MEVMVGGSARRLVELTWQESLHRLAATPFGRVVFTQRALPAIRPVNHIVDHGMIIIRTHLGAGVLAATGMIVAYEADDIDPREHVGWSVIATGHATVVDTPEDVTRYQRLLRSWVTGQRDEIISIQPELVTGYRLTHG